MRFLFLLFVIMPILEMWVLIEVGSRIGSLMTIGAVLLTAVIGASLLKNQGLHTLMRAQQRLDSGQIPANEILEGLLLAVAGALLLTPGFVTDSIGFCFLVPALRQQLSRQMLRQGVFRVQGAGFRQAGSGSEYREFHGRTPGPTHGDDARGNVTIEGDFRRDD